MSAEPDLLQSEQPQAEQEPSPGGPASPGDPASPSKGAYGLVLSINRVKAFIKEFGEVKSISTEACFLVAKATELLLESMAERSAQQMQQAGREEVSYNDVAGTVAAWGPLDFLQDVVPKKVPAAVVLDRMKGPS